MDCRLALARGHLPASARHVGQRPARPAAPHKLSGAADVSSSDGQSFPTSGRGEAVGAINAHYGREASALFYTHISGRHAPRIPNLAERRLYAFESANRWPALTPFIAGRPDDKLIVAHWEDVLRLTASVRTGVVSASLMLKRLGNYPRQNGLAQALREIGRIERTLYTLDWLEQPKLRRPATAQLNKGESRHALARAVCFRRLSHLLDGSVEAQQHRAIGLALVPAAI